MPNHYTSKVQITGPREDVAAFRATHIVDNGVTAELRFDFNTIIPMPAILRDSESSSSINEGLMVLGSKLAKQTLESYLVYGWVKEAGVTTVEGVRGLLVKRSPDCLSKAMRAIEAHRQTGHMDWYTWSRDNWGTKWNSYEFGITCDKPGRLNFNFDTAWCPPIPVFQKLLEMWPTLKIKVTGRDECDRHWETIIAA